jgi:hypothetical protein
MNKLAAFIPLALSLVTGACTITTSNDIDPTPLAGYVSGQPWDFVAGSTDGFLSEGEDNFFAVFYPQQYTACGISEPNAPHLIVAVPKTIGDYSMNLSRNMTFVDGNDNRIAVDGRIVVDDITATTVTGGMHGKYDFDNEVSGQFTLTICP